MPEWSNGADSKSVDRFTPVRGFESLPLRQIRDPRKRVFYWADYGVWMNAPGSTNRVKAIWTLPKSAAPRWGEGAQQAHANLSLSLRQTRDPRKRAFICVDERTGLNESNYSGLDAADFVRVQVG